MDGIYINTLFIGRHFIFKYYAPTIKEYHNISIYTHAGEHTQSGGGGGAEGRGEQRRGLRAKALM